VGTEDVFTNILSWAGITQAIGTAMLLKATFAGRVYRSGYSNFVRTMSLHRQVEVFRWDSLFLRPINTPARELVAVLEAPMVRANVTKILLKNPGDTLVIDNWRMLHGRDRVPTSDTVRQIERVYLSEVFG
jgi:hypothetical protein